MSKSSISRKSNHQRRAATIVLVAITVPVLFAFVALTVDVGLMYNAKGDLQRAADAAALAAATALSDRTVADPIAEGRLRAHGVTTDNPVLGRTIVLVDSDITFGKAVLNGAGQYDFNPTNNGPTAVRVVARMTDDSPNGPLPLVFAKIFGILETNVTAEAIAAFLPRDIAIVADLSGSHAYDSRFMHYRQTSINMYDVWDHLPGGAGDPGSIWDEVDPLPPAQMVGPAWGLLTRLGFGTINITSSYNPNSDPGLVRLPRNQNWNDSTVFQYLSDLGYSSAEVSAILSTGNDGGSGYTNRVAVALGLAAWNSGMPGGLWETLGLPASGNGNGAIGGNEITFVERFGDRSLSESANVWRDYIGNFASSGNTEMVRANSNLRYQYGAKTFIEYLLDRRLSHEDTPELADTPHQPMQAVKDAVNEFTSLLQEQASADQVSLETYSTFARHEIDLTTDHALVSERLNGMQAGYYENYTNIGAGMLRGIEELTGPRANAASQKIMILLTDGNANIACDGCTQYNPPAAKQYARDMAYEALDNDITIYTVSVGADSDTNLMTDIAAITNGTHFHAEGTIDQYSDQLDAIFAAIGGHRSIQLIK